MYVFEVNFWSEREDVNERVDENKVPDHLVLQLTDTETIYLFTLIFFPQHHWLPFTHSFSLLHSRWHSWWRSQSTTNDVRWDSNSMIAADIFKTTDLPWQCRGLTYEENEMYRWRDEGGMSEKMRGSSDLKQKVTEGWVWTFQTSHVNSI